MNLRSATLVFWLLDLVHCRGRDRKLLLDDKGRDDTCLSGSRYRTGWGQVREHRSSSGGKSRRLSNVDRPAVLHAGVLEGSARHGESRRCEKLKKLGKGSSCGLQHNGGWTLIVYHRATSAQTFDAWLPTGGLALCTYEVSASPLPTITLPFALESICLRFCREAMTSSSSSGPRASILKMS